MKRPFQAMIASVAWMAVIIDFSLSGRHLVQYISYFTIESNLLIAISLTIAVVLPGSKAARWILSPSFQTALAVYILVVAMVYNIVLRNTWAITGWGSIIDDLLHVVIPALYLVYWLIYIPYRSLKWADVLIWLIFPAIYLIYTFIRGEVIGRYPYPIIDVTKLGYAHALINSGFVAAGFLATGILLIIWNRTRIVRIKQMNTN